MTEMFNMVYHKEAERIGSPMDDVTAEIKLCDIDSTLGIQAVIAENGLKKGLEILSCMRKEARRHGASMGRFIVKEWYVKDYYLLDDNGNVAIVLQKTFDESTNTESVLPVMHEKDFRMACGIGCLHTELYL